MSNRMCALLIMLLLLPGTLAAQVRGQGRGQAAQQQGVQAQQGRGMGAGQAVGRGMGQGQMLLREAGPELGPIDVLLELREPLRLSAEQVQQLQNVDTTLTRQNGALLTELVEIRRQVQQLGARHPRELTPAQRQILHQQTQRAAPLMLRIQANNCTAMERVGQLLTAEQRGWMRGWLQTQAGAGTDTLPARGAGFWGLGGYCQGGPGGIGRIW